MGEALAVLAALLFGLGGLLSRAGIEDMPRAPGYAVSVLSSAGTIYIVGLPWIVLGMVRPVTLEGAVYFVAGGLSGTLLGRMASLASIQHIGPSRAALYKNTQPLLTTVLAIVLLGETFTAVALGGGLILVTGVWIATAEPLVGQGAARWGIVGSRARRAGVAFGLLAALGFSVSNIMRKLAIDAWPDPILGAALAATTALAVSSTFWASGGVRRSLTGKAPRDYAVFLGVGVLLSAAQVAFLGSLMFAEVWVATLIVSTEPMLVAVLSKVFLPGREQFTPRSFGGGLLVVLGVAFVLAG